MNFLLDLKGFKGRNAFQVFSSLKGSIRGSRKALCSLFRGYFYGILGPFEGLVFMRKAIFVLLRLYLG